MKPRTRKLIVGTAAAVACLAILVTGAYYWVTGIRNAAESGRTQAEAGARSLAAHDATAAASQFGAASRSFSRAQAMLGPEWLDGIASVVPAAKLQYSAARTLLAIGFDASTAGAELAAALREAPATTTTAGSSEFGTMLTDGRAHIDKALVALIDIADRAAGLSETGLVPPLAGAVRSLKTALADATPFLGRIRAMLALERRVLSSDRRLLVIAQNNAELRPTGGFAGSYGIVDIGPSGLRLEKYADVYSLPGARGSLPKPPGNHFPVFAFRDANWWLDFPTSARAWLTFWADYRQPQVDGVIAIDIVAMRDLLEVFGPIEVPSYSETFTADNLLERLVYLVEVKSGGGPGKKGVLVDLANELEKRVLIASPSELAQAALILAKAADAKHVQMYFADPRAQAAAAELGWAGAITPPAGTTDLMAVSNTMNYAGKANMGVKKTIDYRVALAPDGSADTTLVLRYANTGSWAVPPGQRSAFRDYLRVYGMPGTMFLPDPANPGGSTMMVDTGLPAVAREFSVRRGRSRTETVMARVPDAWRSGAMVAAPRSTGSPGAGAPLAPESVSGSAHYRLFVVRQADLQDVPTTIVIKPPAGWRVSSVRAWKAASGESLAASKDEAGVRLALPLAGDLFLDVGLEPR